MNHHAPNHYGYGITNAELSRLREERASLLKALDDVVAAFDAGHAEVVYPMIRRARLVLTTLKQEDKHE